MNTKVGCRLPISDVQNYWCRKATKVTGKEHRNNSGVVFYMAEYGCQEENENWFRNFSF